MRVPGYVLVAAVTGCVTPRAPPPAPPSGAVPAAPAERPATETRAPAIDDATASEEPPAEPAPHESTSPPPPPAEPAAQEPATTPVEAKACAARGGTIQPVCMLGKLECVVRYRDAGNPCTDGAQCLGECLYEGEDPPPAKPVGRCQRTSDPCGCKAPIVSGRVEPALCVD